MSSLSTVVCHLNYLSQMLETNSSSMTKPGIFAQEPKTVAAHVDSSESECRNRDTFSLPLEKPRSTSVEAAYNRCYFLL
jgi:hypothetical protein